MIPNIYHRSSSLNNWEYCQNQFFITYSLGYTHSPNLRAEMGTCTHKILELLAIAKKNLQEGKDRLEDKELGIDIKIEEEVLLKPRQLSLIEIDTINSTRINKDVYKTPCNLKYGHVRYGVELVEELINKCYTHYKNKSPHDWQPMCFKHVTNWVWMVLDYKDGIYDPRKNKIYATERHFDLELTEDWAKYDFKYKDKIIKGNLRLKGTIDLTLDHGDILEIVDWKTGQKKDWAKDQPKTYSSLQHDSQLLMYYYAASKIYPKDVLVSIFFVRDGGPYSICFTQDRLDEALELFKTKFEEMKNTEIPKLLDPEQKDFRCNKLCDFYKNKMNGISTCKFIHNKLHEIGMEKVIEKYSNPDFVLGTYDSPGE